MKLKDLIGQEEISFPVFPRLLRWLGINETIFICRFVWWQRQEGEWISKSTSEVQHETGLSYKQQTTARENLVKMGILEQEYRRLEHKLWFRITPGALETDIPDCNMEASAERANGETLESPTPSDKRANGEMTKGQQASDKRANGHNNKDFKDTSKEVKTPSLMRTFTDLWCVRYQEVFGEPYAGFRLRGAQEGMAAKKLLAMFPPDKIMQVAEKAWTKTGKEYWACVELSKTVAQLASGWDRIQNELTRSNGHSDHSKGF